MLFNSYIFFIFAFLFFAGWTFANRKNSTRWFYLTLASLLFYGWWDWRFIFLIIFSGMIDYYAALAIDKYPNHKKAFLTLSLTGNIGSLAIFKYSGFIAENIEQLLGAFGVVLELKTRLPYSFLILPAGISFYTFQSMSYTLDVYRGVLKPTRHIFHFFAYLSMFPQLVAGPIVRAKDILAQLAVRQHVSESDRWDGTRLILAGYFKKVVIADNLAYSVNYAFNSPLA
jgi:D-alanyl-lipoteichoic acid acyltransferase DltB (MBOAT superfamily)